MNILFLDDDLIRHQLFRELVPIPYTPTDTASKTIEKLKSQKWDIICLDHDLGGQTYVDVSHKNTGSEVVRHMVADESIKELQKDAFIIVHSFNAYAVPNMVMDLLAAGYNRVEQGGFNGFQFRYLLDEALMMIDNKKE